ncbi:protein FAR1-RELATED SEQUENCE 5-like [Salvia splendens]|uniref:protein FAR1-RELATED SEQUENCE 5-like n=1 Tax=Salvia splendens TaxID=180675 RepID=UPI001C26D697|nr:protein FAR1-RELATED SEQUENCE 5-like [Salvia splendens]
MMRYIKNAPANTNDTNCFKVAAINALKMVGVEEDIVDAQIASAIEACMEIYADDDCVQSELNVSGKNPSTEIVVYNPDMATARTEQIEIRSNAEKRISAALKSPFHERVVQAKTNRQGSKSFIPGHASKSTEVSVKRRRCRSFRCECLAKLNLRYFSDGINSGYEVYQFVEYHNHLMVADEHRHFMTANRSLDPIHRSFMEDCGRCNIGPTQTFKLLKEIMGGPENVGYAQMIFDYMRSQRELSDAFYYEIEVGSHGKYCMIFAPFTGKDNHSRAVTFGAGLLSSEGRDSYSWLFGCFVRCMGIAPKMIITDQDWGMKLAVQQVLLQTRHRWCMWHIMVKVSDKLPKSLLGSEDFKKEFNACVWSDLLEPDEFDIIWNDIMERYGLEDVHWFGSMFEDRELWVPAYFRDFPMGSLLRTTSMSESENSFFKNYTKPRANLVQFMNFFNLLLEIKGMPIHD